MRNLRLSASLLFAALFAGFQVCAVSRFVAANNPTPTPPYTNWATAAITIQDAVDVAVAGDEVVVTNGTYNTGGRAVVGTVTNRVAVDKLVAVRSVNGPGVTVIDGQNATSGIRCVYLSNGASLSGFTLTNGFSDFGGGVSCDSFFEVVSNCVIIDSVAFESGGGAAFGTLKDCTLTRNHVSQFGFNDDGGGAYSCKLDRCILSGNSGRGSEGLGAGGAARCDLDNCLLVGNFKSAAWAANLYNCTVVANPTLGTSECNVYNSIVYFNGPANSANFISCPMYNCCTMPLPTFMDSSDNITNAPLFQGEAIGDFQLQPTSPCIDAGNNGYVSTPLDLAGNRRIVGNNVDIGAYEFLTDQDRQFFAYLEFYGLPVDGSADFADTDADKLNNYQEWVCGTVPTNAASALRMLAPEVSVSGVGLAWQSVAGRNYLIERATNTGPTLAFQTVATNIVGEAGTNFYFDAGPTTLQKAFYRVGVPMP